MYQFSKTGIEDKQKQMELTLGLGKNYDHFDKSRSDAEHDLDDGTQVMTLNYKGFDPYRSTAVLLLRNPFESLISAKVIFINLKN